MTSTLAEGPPAARQDGRGLTLVMFSSVLGHGG